MRHATGLVLQPVARALLTALRAPAWNELDDEGRDFYPRLTVLENIDPVTVKAALSRIDPRRALVNVVENALHAMPGSGYLTVEATADRHMVGIDVTDTGVGMDEEALARAFEPYFSTKASGTGLGLPIAKRNVELSGGTITVHSVRDQGTTVEISLPALR